MFKKAKFLPNNHSTEVNPEDLGNKSRGYRGNSEYDPPKQSTINPAATFTNRDLI